ncbi:MAG TPA: ATP-binding protein [Gemmatimonadaceae bacterium]|nr:ATP-binding protein [Gemmatimonadaceae bacterium]
MRVVMGGEVRGDGRERQRRGARARRSAWRPGPVFRPAAATRSIRHSLPSHLRALFARFGVRLYTLVLGVVLSLVVAGLYLADLALSRAARSQVALDATESAALVESFLAVQAQALNAFHAVYFLPEGRPDVPRFEALAGKLEEDLGAFRRVWVTDSSGAVVGEHLLGSDAARIAGLDFDTLSRFGIVGLAGRARQTGRVQTSGPGEIFSGGRGFLLLRPVHDGGRFLGFVGGTVRSDSLLARVHRGANGTRNHITIATPEGGVIGTDTVRGPRRRGRRLADQMTVATPGGGQWTVRVEHTVTTAGLRVLLWGVGLAVLGAIVAVLRRERREAVRTAERSRELERLSSELLRANRTKSEFLANVSHELRTPLNAIVGFVDLLRDGVYGELTLRQVPPVERIAASATHLRQLVDQVLDIAKLAAGRLEVHIEPVDLRPFVIDVAGDVESLMQEKALTLSIAVGASLPRVRTDPTHLRQILVNLVGNAVKFTEGGGIAIRARLVNAPMVAGRKLTPESPALAAQMPAPDRVWVALQVIDTGIGIAPADHDRIFNEFEQVNAAARGDSMRRGTGLGLPISRRLARLLGGEISVESALGRGSTFTLWLPVHPADLNAEPRPRRPTPGAAVESAG